MGGSPNAVPGTTSAYADPASTYISVNNSVATSSDSTGSTPGQSIKLHAPGSIILDSVTDLQNHRIVNVAKGAVNAASGDAINGSQLYGVSSSVATALGGGSTVNGDGTISAPSYSVGGTTVNSVGAAITNIDGRTTQNTGNITTLNTNVAQNTSDISSINNSISNGTIGLVQQDQTTRHIMVAKSTDGTVVDMTGTAGTRTLTGVSAGAVNVASVDAINGSQLYSVTSSMASALGGGSTVNGDGTISAPSYSVGGTTVNSVGAAITNIDGRATQNTGNITTLNTNVAQNTSDISSINNSISNGTIGLVQQDQMTRNITVAKSTDGTVVDMTGTGGARLITGVSTGAVNVASVDAINGSQLYSVASSTASALGGGSTVNSDGTISAPSYSVGGTTLNSVGAAITNIDGRTTQNASAIATINNQINSGMIGLVQQDPTTRVITVAKSTDGTVVDMTGTAGTRTVTGVSAGAVNAASVDAINGSQLHSVASSTASALGGGSTVNSDGTISAPTYSVGGTTVNNVGDAMSNIDNRVTQNTNDIAKNSGDIATLNTNVTQNTTNISNLSASVAQNTNDIANITNQINNSAIGMVQQDQTTRNISITKDTDGTVVDMAGTQGARTVTGVAAAALTVDSTDVVNGSQLYQTNLNVSDLSQRFDSLATSTSAFASQTNDTPAIASGTNSTAMGNGASATGNNSVAIGSGSIANEDNTVSFGSQGSERRLTNVAPGVNGTDAVNMNQLNAVQSSVNTVARSAFAGVASAMAMPNLTPSAPGKTIVAAGVANYKGYTAVGLGGTYRSQNNHWLVNAAASVTPSGDTGVRGQVGYEF
jgi:peptidoglycan hydrolase CwlO-like protein